jgi:hypothetical protein
MKTRVIFLAGEKLHKQLAAYAKKHETTMTAVIIAALREYFERQKS